MPLVSKNFSDIITFTRATSATFTGSNGLIQSTPQSKNLLTWTEEFDNAAVWTAFSTIVSANASGAPDGTSTADLVAETTAISSHSVYQAVNVVSGLSYTVSVFVKKGAGATAPDIIQLTFGSTGFGTGQYANFYINTGVLGTVAGGTASITSAGGGWYRISFTATATSTASANNSAILFTNNNDSLGRAPIYTGVTTSDVLIWGAQLEVGSTATSYTKNDGGLFPPRFDYDPVTLAAKGLLIEEQRTNLFTYSEQFDNAAWTKTNATITANAIVAPDGTLTGDKLVEDSTNTVHRVSQQPSSTVTGSTYTLTVYAKKAERNWIILRDVSRGLSAWANLDTGTVGTVQSGLSLSVSPVGNGWYRCVLVRTAQDNSVLWGIQLATADNVTTYTGDGTSGIYLWGAQLEAGSFATSYIPTVASQVTRSADVASVNTLSPWFNATEGTFYVNFSSLYSGSPSGGTPRQLALTPLAGASGYVSYWSGAVVASFDGTNSATANIGVSNWIGPHKVASSYGGATKEICANAGTVGSSAYSGAWSAATGFTSVPAGHIRRITYYPRKLSSAELQAITA